MVFDLGFQHLPRDLANVNAWKTMFDPYSKIKRRHNSDKKNGYEFVIHNIEKLSDITKSILQYQNIYRNVNSILLS